MPQTIAVSASLLSADLGALRAEAKRAEAAGCDRLHMDVMDGLFVPNLTFGAPVIRSLKGAVSLPIEAHLMIQQPERYFEDFQKAGCRTLFFHLEAVENPHRALQALRRLGLKRGVAVNPETPETKLHPFLEEIDSVLFMSVHPGFAGQAFLETVVEKIERFHRFCREKGFTPEIAVDGGINPETAPRVVHAGARVLVAASALFQAPDLAQAVQLLRSSAQKALAPETAP